MATIHYHPILMSKPHLAAELEQDYGLRITVSPASVTTERRPAPRRPTSRTTWAPTGGDAA